MFKDITEMKRYMHIKITNRIATYNSLKEKPYKYDQINLDLHVAI